jgi:hypothetical protein
MQHQNRRSIQTKISKGIVMSAVALALSCPGFASAGTVLIDGVYDSASDDYQHSTNINWFNDHWSQFNPTDPNSTTVRWNDSGEVFAEVPLAAKNLIWSPTGVSAAENALYDQSFQAHHPGQTLTLNYEKATGSEKFKLAATGYSTKDSNTVDGITYTDRAVVDGVIVDFKEYGASSTDVKTSIDWVVANRGCSTGNSGTCGATDVEMSFEKLFTGGDKTTVLAWLNDWKAGTANLVGLVSHLSPERGGPLSQVPVPAAFWLFGTALIGFIGISRRTNLA